MGVEARPPVPAVFLGRSLAMAVTRLAWPIIVENLFQSAILLIDLLYIAKLGAAAVAGVGTATQIMWLVLSTGSVVAIGATVTIAQAYGRGAPDEASHVGRQALIAAVLLGVLGVVFSPLAEAMIAWMGPEESVITIGGSYLRINLLSFVLVNVMMVVSACLRGAGDSRTPMLVTGAITLVHVGVDYVLVFGLGDWAGWGAVGSALAGTVSRGIGSAMLLFIVLRPSSRVPIAARLSAWRFDARLIWRLFKLGGPAALEQIILSFGFLLYSAMVLPLGTVAYATQRISFNLMSLSFMPGMGYGMAATTLTGQAVGAQRPDLARRSSNVAVLQAGVIMSLAGGLFFFAGDGLMALFSDDPQIIALGADGLKVLALCQPFWALGQVFSGSLRGGGDTRYPMWVTMGGMWMLRLPIGYLLGITLGYGLPGVYFSSLFDAAFRGLMNLVRFRRAPWLRDSDASVNAAAVAGADD